MDAAVKRSVLLLDDDGSFRSLISDILKRRNINVIAARSVKEATAYVSEGDPLLAIVDYRLGESDGMSWITLMRESGRNFPVVFLSGTWCDEKTFNWLRNILKVSLILKKPIEPELFLQQIEGLLPNLAATAEYAAIEDDDIFGTDEEDEHVALASADPALLGELKQMRAGIKMKSRLAEARSNYASELANSWNSLTEWITGAERDQTNKVLQNEALLLAHRIYGTSGSLGFSKVSKAAGKIEELLQGLDPLDTLAGVIWSEIRNNLVAGLSEIEKSLTPATESTTSGITIAKLLVVGKADDFRDNTRGLQTLSSVDFEIAESVAAASLTAKRIGFEGAIIDFSSGGLTAILGLIEELRLKQGSSFPIAAICPPGTNVGAVDLLYCGASIVLRSAPDKGGMEELVNQLICLRDQYKPRVLTVDDDELLTDFLTQVLTSHSMNVRALNRPINILQAMEEFNPELVLLDVHMPGISGYDVCRMLRASEQWSQVPVIFLTSKTDHEARAAAFQSGGTDFLCKPVISEELVARARGQLDSARMKHGQAQRDPLTGLMNGDELITQLREMIEAKEKTNEPVSLVLWLIDDYLEIGSEHGWQGAEQILKQMAQLLCNRFRSEDIRARLGQDGFGLVLPSVSKETVTEALEKMREEFAEVRFPSNVGKSFKATFVAGIADSLSDGKDAHSLLIAANSRLMSYKRERQNARG